tara:strand:- start:1516 stop:1824 length:309 start_codon:yes stop_codon:yes gene_type:complete
LGNLRTALISLVRARLNNGQWILRIDALDTPRNYQGAIEKIQKDLIWLCLKWDGPIIFQSKRKKLYESILEFLKTIINFILINAAEKFYLKRVFLQEKVLFT